MERRLFLSTLAFATGGLLTRRYFDFFIPDPLTETTPLALCNPLDFDAINTICVKELVPGILDAFFRTDPILKFIRDQDRTGMEV